MAEQLHQDLQAYTGVDQRRGVGVAQLVWRDDAQSGRLGDVRQFVTQGVQRKPPPLMGQQKLHQPPGSWMAERTPRRTVRDDAIDERQRLVIQRPPPLAI